MKNPKMWLLALSILMLAAFTPVTQGVQRFVTILTQNITVSNTATFNGATTFNGANTVTGATTLDDVTLTGNIANRSLFLRYQDVAAAPSIRALATEIATTTTTITTSILGIDTPRNVSITYETVTTATAGNIVITGIDARGNAATDTIAVAAVNGIQTVTGVVPFKSITQITLPQQTDVISLTVAGGQLFGLPLVPVAAGDVYHLTVNKTPQAAPTVSTTYGTFNPVSTPAADVDYNVWVKQ